MTEMIMAFVIMGTGSLVLGVSVFGLAILVSNKLWEREHNRRNKK